MLSVQLQMPAFTVTLNARDLSFAEQIITFVAETRGNPAFRDAHLGGGVYRSMPEKEIDLSPSFPDCLVTLVKDGEYDSGYVLRIKPSSTFEAILDLRDDQLDAFLKGIHEIVDS